RLPVRRRLVQTRRPAAGRLRPQRGGWRGQRRGLADALYLQRFNVVGHLDYRWRGALRIVLREDAFLSGVHSANRPRAGLRVLCGAWRPGVLRILRRAVTLWTSTY